VGGRNVEWMKMGIHAPAGKGGGMEMPVSTNPSGLKRKREHRPLPWEQGTLGHGPLISKRIYT